MILILVVVAVVVVVAAVAIRLVLIISIFISSVDGSGHRWFIGSWVLVWVDFVYCSADIIHFKEFLGG